MIFIKTNQIYPFFSLIYLMEILKIYLKEQFLINYYVIKHVVLSNIQNMMDINVDLDQWLTHTGTRISNN